MSERRCSVCGAQEPEVKLAIAADDGVVVLSQRSLPLGVRADLPFLATDFENVDRPLRAGDVVCMSHTAVRPDGNYVRLEDGG